MKPWKIITAVVAATAAATAGAVYYVERKLQKEDIYHYYQINDKASSMKDNAVDKFHTAMDTVSDFAKETAATGKEFAEQKGEAMADVAKETTAAAMEKIGDKTKDLGNAIEEKGLDAAVAIGETVKAFSTKAQNIADNLNDDDYDD